LTPGAHDEYFFRAQNTADPQPIAARLAPDTTLVFGQPTEGGSGFDMRRWEDYSVLPDRWKAAEYTHPVYQKTGRGPACMLVVDMQDGGGDEGVWIGVADTIGATSSQKWGAANGWSARGDQSVNDPATFVAQHGGQPGDAFDYF